MFIETIETGFVALSRVVSMAPASRHGSGTLRYDVGNGQTATVHHSYEHSDLEELSRRRNVVPASGGFIAVTCSDIGEIFKSPVVAWSVDTSGEMSSCYPITIGVDEPAELSVLCPNGEVITPHGDKYYDLKSWVNEQQRRRANASTAQVSPAGEIKDGAV